MCARLFAQGDVFNIEMIDRLDVDGVANLNSNIFSSIPLNPVALTSHIVYTNDYVPTVCVCLCRSRILHYF